MRDRPASYREPPRPDRCERCRWFDQIVATDSGEAIKDPWERPLGLCRQAVPFVEVVGIDWCKNWQEGSRVPPR